MGITLEVQKIVDDLLTTMSRVFGGLPGGLPCRLLLWARSLRRQRALSVQPL
jgi:TRAP-type mannitol/chloroaromatic compound transport system permease large subunit